MTANENIAGTNIANTKEGVLALTRSILKNERDRVARNNARQLGNFIHDLNAASRILAEIDVAVTVDWEGIEESQDASVSDLVSIAHTAVDNAIIARSHDRHIGMADVITPLERLRDDLAVYAQTLAQKAIELDTVVRDMSEGEPE